MQPLLIRDSQFLRQQLEALLAEARRNEAKMERFDRLEQRLMAASTVGEIVHLVLEDYPQVFGIEQVALVLVDTDHEIADVLAQAHTDFAALGLRLIPEANPLAWHFSGDASRFSAPKLETFSPVRHGGIFGDQADSLCSLALLPLVRQGQLQGCLYLGSACSERYAAGAGTHFLARLASILAICLDSVLSRERLKRVGFTDPLTSVHNRRYFEHRCSIDISQARRYGHALACVLIDIDHFKSVNDRYGHPAGDAVLQGVAAVIRQQLRPSDTLARFGGEEFVVLLPMTDRAGAADVAERIRAQLEAAHFSIGTDMRIRVTASLGLAMLPSVPPSEVDAGAEAGALVLSADQALYQAKSAGRNRVVQNQPTLPGDALALSPWARWLSAIGQWGRSRYGKRLRQLSAG